MKRISGWFPVAPHLAVRARVGNIQRGGHPNITGVGFEAPESDNGFGLASER